MRDNLDPFSEHEEATLNDALRAAGLHSLADSRPTFPANVDEVSLSSDTESFSSSHTQVSIDFLVTLDTKVEAGGANFSVGQRSVIQ